MIRSRMRTFGAIVGVAVIGATFAGCDALSSSASCEDFQSEYASFGNPKITEMVSKAYFKKFDESSVSGLTMMKNLELVRVGCQNDPGAKIDSFVER